MSRRLLALAALLLIGTILCLPQQGNVPGLILSELQLISQETLPNWSSAWSGPIQAATLVAWFGATAFPELRRDRNGDGTVNEQDTIALADLFGMIQRGNSSELEPSDVRMAVNLAEYIASELPGRFQMVLYDAGFADEFWNYYGRTFSPDLIGGIEIVLEDDPTLDDYVDQLVSGAAIMIGIEEDEGINTYLTGRSFLYPEPDAAFTAVGFVWAKEDRLQSGNQATILDTVGIMDNGFYIDFHDWVPVEFMLALVPIGDSRDITVEYTCPDDERCFTTLASTDEGDVQVLASLVRQDDSDTYIYTVRNVSLTAPDGGGIRRFSVPNVLGLAEAATYANRRNWIFSSFPEAALGSSVGIGPISPPPENVMEWLIGPISPPPENFPQELIGPISPPPESPLSVAIGPISPPPENFSQEFIGPISPPPELPGDTLGIWSWAAPEGDDGIMPGEFGVFAIKLPGCTSPALVAGAIGTVAYDPWPEPDPRSSGIGDGGDPRRTSRGVYTSAPGEQPAEEEEAEAADDASDASVEDVAVTSSCPDLTVEILSESCDLRNPYETPFPSPYLEVRIRVKNIGDVAVTSRFRVTLVPEKLPSGPFEDIAVLGAGQSRTVTLGSYIVDRCSDYTVIVDSSDAVAECDETNNIVEDRDCCPSS